MKLPQVGVAILPYSNFLSACLPLFDKGEIELLEWPFDIFSSEENIPNWMKGLREEFSQNQRLIGHGVYYSLFDAKWSERQNQWISKLKKEASNVNFNHITEHFGIMSSNDAHKGYPMPVVFSEALLSLGIDRMKRLQNAAQVPVGLENLALAFSADDVKEQGDFLERLVSNVNGFIILDLHNLYCQSQNFGIQMEELMNLYPLHLVKEIHVSGGSWSNVKGEKVRRDTHDNPVPDEVWISLQYALKKCPNLEYIILEQLNGSLGTEKAQVEFRADFMKIRELVQTYGTESNGGNWGNSSLPGPVPLNDNALFDAQQELKQIFSGSLSLEEVKNRLAHIYPDRKWESKMLETGLLLADRWN
jgi:uncharacterized protein (UPF0276 family)